MKKGDKETFVSKARLIHNNAFSYNNAVYVNNSTKLIITCKKHGDFLQIPSNHLSGRGCIVCSGKKQKNTQTFIEEANKKHNYKYKYDKVNYVTNYAKIIISCEKHGDFSQTPTSHLSGRGCMECSGKTEKNTEKFISEANKKHNYKYNYDKVNYTKIHSRVIITCKKHGDFTQTPGSHLWGIGCSDCSGKKQKNTEIFIELANKKHNYKYNYDKVNYVNNYTKIIITCEKHGCFSQTPNSHLNGTGCLECSGTKRSNCQKFIEEANKTHKGNYDYDKVVYKNSITKVIITCKKHGDFEQTAKEHLKGNGCPKCKASTGEKLISEMLQKMNLKFEHQYKFEDCIYKRKLPFDFVVFIDNRVKLIEFHGKQHYEYVSFFHSKNGRDESLLRDKIKQDYAIENNIDLLIIPYNLTHQIEPLLIDFLEI